MQKLRKTTHFDDLGVPGWSFWRAFWVLDPSWVTKSEPGGPGSQPGGVRVDFWEPRAGQILTLLDHLFGIFRGFEASFFEVCF